MACNKDWNSTRELLRQCLKFRVSLRGSPQRFSNAAVPKLCHNPMQKSCRGLPRARSRFPEIVGNTRKRKQRKESMECGLVLAKQVLSQLSYTPTVRVPFILKHFSRFQNPFPRILRQTVPHLLSLAKITSVPKTRQFSMRACHRNRNGTGNLAQSHGRFRWQSLD